MPYQVSLSRSAQKQLTRLAQDVELGQRLRDAIDYLTRDPRPPSSEPLKGRPHEYRVRVGDYRILYTTYDAGHEILVGGIRHRKDAYRR
jgi:mRNA interferase RelE/StbE